MHQRTSEVTKVLLSIGEFQAATGLSRTKTYQLISSGDLATVHVGRRRLVPAEALQEWVKGLGVQPPSATKGGRDAG